MSLPKWARRSKDEDRRLRKEMEKYQATYGKDYLEAPIDIVMRLDASVLNGLPSSVLQKLPPDGWKRLSGDGLAKLPLDILSQLEPEDMRRLPLHILETLPPADLARLAAPGILTKLSPEKLGMVLPELENNVLTAMPLESIINVHPQQLAKISQQGLAGLARRYSDLYLLFEKLHHDELLQLPLYILDEIQFERFKKIPWKVWLEQPDEVLLNLPPDIRKSLPKELWAARSAQNQPPPLVSSVEGQVQSSSPAPLEFPVDFSRDGSLAPKGSLSGVPPPVPPRHHKPPLSHTNQLIKRNNSFSAARSQTSSPSNDFRNQASRYMESAFATDRRGSRSTNDGSDIRDNLAYRPAPATPDGIPRKEVPDPQRVIEELNEDLIKKNKIIEELEARIKEREGWWQQRVNDESDKIVDLKVGMKSSADVIFNALVAMAPDRQWDRSVPDPTALMIGFAKELNAWKQSSSKRILECLNGIAPDVYDQSHPDPTDAIVQYLKQVHGNAGENFTTATYYREEYHAEKEKNARLELELESALKESRAAKDELITAQFDLQESKKALLLADGRESDYGMQVGQLRRERDGYFTQLKELEKRIETERGVAQTNLINQQTHYENQTKGIKQQNIDLQTQLGVQKEKYAKELKTQHDYYEGIRKQQEALVETLTKTNQEALQQAEKKRKEDLKAQLLQFNQQLEKSRAHYDEKLERERQSHELVLKNNAVHLQEKIKSLESDLVDNSDDFRPATDDSLKTKYGTLKLMVETITETFNLGTVTIPQDGRFDPDNFVAREGKGQTRVLLRSIVWTKIIDGFFSSPFGFGSFGSTQGKTLLLELYSAWRKLFGDGPLPVSGFHVPDEIFELFRTDKEANKWRSATFQSILMAVSPRGQKKNQAAANGHLVKPFADNRQKVHDDILDILNQVCNDQVQPEIAEKIVEIVQLAGELALEFGAQRAELALDTPAKGESITIGPEFVDCEDGESERGKVKEVELLVLPKLFRIGDGRNDLKTRKIIVPGEIYPRRS